MKKLTAFLGLLAFPLVSAASSAVFDQVARELPAGTYAGFQHNGKACTVKVEQAANREFGAVYTVTVAYASNVKPRVFEMHRENEALVGTPVVKAQGDLRTRVTVGRGKFLRSRETYAEGYEKELLLEIREVETARKIQGRAWRISVGAMNYPRNGFGILSCHIPAL